MLVDDVFYGKKVEALRIEIVDGTTFVSKEE